MVLTHPTHNFLGSLLRGELGVMVEVPIMHNAFQPTQDLNSYAGVTGKVRVLSHAREKTPGSQVARSIYQHNNSIPFTACGYILHRLSINYIFITKGSRDVTHCARYTLANTRPYQLHWGDWKMGTGISCRMCSQVPGLIQAR